MLFYFQVSNNNREESHQKSEETDEDEAAIDNSVKSWIGYWYLLLLIYLHIYHCQPEETDEDRAAHENLKKSKPSERSVVAMQAKYKVQVQVQAKYKVAENISIFCVDLTKKQLVICDLFDQDLVIWPRTALQPNTFKSSKKKLFITDGTDATLTGYCMYFLRWFKTSFFGDEWFCWMKIISIKSTAKARPSKYWIFNRQDADHFMLWFNDIDLQSRTQTKRTLGEETFQREIMGGLINGITLCQNIKVMKKIGLSVYCENMYRMRKGYCPSKCEILFIL